MYSIQAQQNSFNLVHDNLAFEECSPKTRSFAIPNFHSISLFCDFLLSYGPYGAHQATSMVSKDPKMSKQGTTDKWKHVTKHWIINFVQYKEMEQPNTIIYGIK
jgi:hypothetical protein